MFHIYDNASYHTAKATGKYFREKTDVKIYPRGSFHGYKNGFPPYSPDFNFIAEAVIGHVKRLAAEHIATKFDALRRKQLTVVGLAQILREEFRNITDEHIDAYRDHMLRSMDEAIGACGAYGAGVKKTAKPKERRVTRLIQVAEPNSEDEQKSDSSTISRPKAPMDTDSD